VAGGTAIAPYSKWQCYQLKFYASPRAYRTVEMPDYCIVYCAISRAACGMVCVYSSSNNDCAVS
jgi:hypothetical protein